MQGFFNWPNEHPALFFSIFSIGLLVVHLAGLRLKGALTLIALILIFLRSKKEANFLTENIKLSAFNERNLISH
jgi:hypothetical protein